ncbi:MAG: Gfo/Idh/MocA family oxidoreductase [Eubacteriales bacterium]|nr:Gfo/Idh/MocA family oxidoreductase [Eubacteriales bacterium]
MKSKLKVAVAGLGSRGYDTYALITKKFPEDIEITAVADARNERIEEFKRNFDISDERCFKSTDELLSHEKLADVLFICTLDRMHYGEAMTALGKGYDILLEKPISTNAKECRDIAEAANRLGRKVVVCHVLRYTVFYQKIKEIISSGVIGDIVSIQAIERVCYWHQAHSFVRGNWRNSETTSPMILQKCCHDMDIYLWLAGKRCKAVTSFGALSYFRKENSPEGASERCTNKCSIYDTCVYNPYKFYGDMIKRNDFGWPLNVVCAKKDINELNKALENDQYGKCVFNTDNNVVDHQVVNLLLEGDSTISFTMSAFTAKPGRNMQIMGTKGNIEASMDENKITVEVFGKEPEHIDVKLLTDDFSGHGGGDGRMMNDLIQLVRLGKTNPSVTTIDRSVESHYVALAAEESRLDGGRVIELEDYIKNIK